MAINTNNSNNYLHIASDMVIAGMNTQEVHATFSDTSFITQTGGDWSSDGGDLAAPANTREPRIFCIKGTATLQFSGTSVALRISVNPGWGTASILIDGVKPSTIAGVVTPNDTVTCNSDTLDLLGNQYIDQIVADNLPDGAHTLTITCNNSSTQQAFFVLSGYKVYSYAKKSLQPTSWAISVADRQQPISLTFESFGGLDAAQAQVTFDSALLNKTTLQPLGTVTLGNVDSSNSPTVSVLPNFAGTETTGTHSYPVTLQYLVPDPNGTVPVTQPVTIPANSSLLVQKPTSQWAYQVADGTTFPEACLYISGSNVIGSSLSFPASGDSLTVRMLSLTYATAPVAVFKSTAFVSVGRNVITVTKGASTVTYAAGVSLAGVTAGMTYVGPGFAYPATVVSVSGQVVTLNKAAASAVATVARNTAFGTPSGLLTPPTNGATAPNSFSNQTLTGLGTNFNGTIVLSPTGTTDCGIASVTTTSSALYSQMTDSISLDFQIKQVPPQAVTDVSLQNGQIVYTAPDPNGYDLTSDTPYDNRGVESTEIDYRFPTFVVCYSAGFTDTFAEYDIVITDPAAINWSQTNALRQLGIQVYHYVSFGEEDGTLTDRYDSTSALGPYKGDGQGPGGYASYYMKGGYQFGEVSECSNDNERLTGVSSCAQNQTSFYRQQAVYGESRPPRCSKACTNDARDGYIQWQAGEACGGGYTSANNWIRDADNACSNNSCPKYNPVNGKCPKYAQTQNVYGQDFSLAMNFPDENGVWNSYYINAVSRTNTSWFARLRDHYLPLVFNAPTAVDEIVMVSQHTYADNSTAFVTDLTQAPIDEGFGFTLTDVSTGYQYTPNVDYSIDKMLGAVVFSVAVNTPQVAPLPSVGQQIRAQYTKRGLEADGVFMDTVDTVDIYADPVYQNGFADMINTLKTYYPNKKFCSNRGFTIFDKVAASCASIMTESVFSEYNFDTKQYYFVTGDAAVFNDNVAKNLQDNRRETLFDVVCLNYAPNDSSGDAIRATVRQKTMEQGWMPWLSTILLNAPLPNNEFNTGTGFVRSNAWRSARKVIPIKAV